jgi:hypothetical protein
MWHYVIQDGQRIPKLAAILNLQHGHATENILAKWVYHHDNHLKFSIFCIQPTKFKINVYIYLHYMSC